MKMVVALEVYAGGYLALAYSGKSDAPQLGWFTSDDEFVRKAGTGYLSKRFGINTKRWLAIVNTYLSNEQNDALRARGDIRWRVASRAQNILQNQMEPR